MRLYCAKGQSPMSVPSGPALTKSSIFCAFLGTVAADAAAAASALTSSADRTAPSLIIVPSSRFWAQSLTLMGFANKLVVERNPDEARGRLSSAPVSLTSSRNSGRNSNFDGILIFYLIRIPAEKKGRISYPQFPAPRDLRLPRPPPGQFRPRSPDRTTTLLATNQPANTPTLPSPPVFF